MGVGIGSMFAVMQRWRDLERVKQLWEKNQAENTEMVDLGRSLLTTAGILSAGGGQRPSDGRLDVPPALRQYTTAWVQQSLNKVLGTHLAVDSDLGSNTRQAVARFQGQHNLKVDGDPGVQTVAVLELALEQLGAPDRTPAPPPGSSPPRSRAPGR
jgi:peptidoglycan hydrolase-like protein with peptidoglycan-binding domain